jgi:spermidine/putrescine transport system substrate-binding protein|tara:strand:+ start:7723 stop:8796 length:1074 start_codon:yes stop_codon:yes gene_type:complete
MFFGKKGRYRMKKIKLTSLYSSILTVGVLASQGAFAAGELNIFNWGNYTNPELVVKFEKTYDVKVTVTDYDSNDAALAKVKAGGHGFDIVVPSANYMPIWISEGLLIKTRPDQMENFDNVSSDWNNPDWDIGRHYSVPWVWGSVGNVVDTSMYKGDINTSAIFLDPPDELVGKINVPPEMSDVIGMALYYVGSEPCTSDKAALKRASEVLTLAKPKWLSQGYGIIEKFAGRDLGASLYWNGAGLRARQKNSDVRFGYPREGYILWMDSVVVLKDANNVENAKLFQNFIMEPENAAMISNFAMYANGIDGSSEFMSSDLTDAPEVQIPAKHLANGHFMDTCSPAVNTMYTAIWTELLK